MSSERISLRKNANRSSQSPVVNSLNPESSLPSGHDPLADPPPLKARLRSRTSTLSSDVSNEDKAPNVTFSETSSAHRLSHDTRLDKSLKFVAPAAGSDPDHSSFKSSRPDQSLPLILPQVSPSLSPPDSVIQSTSANSPKLHHYTCPQPTSQSPPGADAETLSNHGYYGDDRTTIEQRGESAPVDSDSSLSPLVSTASMSSLRSESLSTLTNFSGDQSPVCAEHPSRTSSTWTSTKLSSLTLPPSISTNTDASNTSTRRASRTRRQGGGSSIATTAVGPFNPFRSTHPGGSLLRTLDDEQQLDDDLYFFRKFIPISHKTTKVESKSSRLRGSDYIGSDHRSFESDDFCTTCLGKGELLCCDTCPRVFHHYCTPEGFDPNDTPEGAWKCHVCSYKDAKLKDPDRRMSSSSLESKRKVAKTDHEPTPSSPVKPGKMKSKNEPVNIESLFDSLLDVLGHTSPRVFQLPKSWRETETTFAHPATGAHMNLDDVIITSVYSKSRGSKTTKRSIPLAPSNANTDQTSLLPVNVNFVADGQKEEMAPSLPQAQKASSVSLPDPSISSSSSVTACQTQSVISPLPLESHQLKEEELKISICFSCQKSDLKLDPTILLGSSLVEQPRSSGTNPLQLNLNRSDMIQCDYCSLYWHLDCLDPPLSTLPPELRKGEMETLELGEIIYLEDRIWGRQNSPLDDIDSYLNVEPRLGDYKWNIRSLYQSNVRQLKIRRKWMCPCHLYWAREDALHLRREKQKWMASLREKAKERIASGRQTPSTDTQGSMRQTRLARKRNASALTTTSEEPSDYTQSTAIPPDGIVLDDVDYMIPESVDSATDGSRLLFESNIRRSFYKYSGEKLYPELSARKRRRSSKGILPFEPIPQTDFDLTEAQDALYHDWDSVVFCPEWHLELPFSRLPKRG